MRVKKMPSEIGPILADYWTKQELAKQLKTTVRTVERLEEQRIGPPRVVIGRIVLYRKEAVKDWLLSLEKGNPRRARSARHLKV